MKSTKTPPKAIRGYARNEKDAKRLEAAGLLPRQIYRADKGQTLDKFKMRQGEYLGVVDGLLAFGKGRRDIGAAVKTIHLWGAAVLDVETGCRSNQHGVKMLNAALDPPKPSAEYMAELARQKAEKRRDANGVMSKRDAIVHWRNPKLSVKEAIDLMHGWKTANAYKVLGRRDVPAGRRPNK
jgi:hypothetical protein